MPREITHLDARGRARMVDVGDKRATKREAIARAIVRMAPSTLRLLLSGGTPKGDVLATARIAGIQAAKKTPELIPLCHAIALTSVSIEIAPAGAEHLHVVARTRASDRTGVEMEALVAASVAALTIYDMLKAIDRAMSVEHVALLEKRGGRSGTFLNEAISARDATRSASPPRGRSRGPRAGSPARRRKRRIRK